MKYLKYLLYVILGLILFYVLLCILGPKNMNVTETISINSPASIPYNLTNHSKKSELWNSWTMNDTTLVTEYNDIVSGVGSKSSWVSQLTGEGTQEITETVLNTKVRSKLNFKGWNGDNFAEFNFVESGNKTDVSYSFEGTTLPFLIKGFALVTGMKKSMHVNYKESLDNLKKLSEEREGGLYNGYEITEQELGEKHFLMNRQKVAPENIQQFYATNLGALFTKVQTADVEMKGMPCGLYFNWPEDGNGKVDMAAAIPIAEPISIRDATTYTIPARTAIVLDFYGNYNTIGDGHDAIEEYMIDRSYLPYPPAVEEYVTDPGEEPDPNKWLTKMTQYFSVTQ